DECEFRSQAETTSVIRCKHVDVDTKEIRAHVEAGRRVHRMAMNWQDRLSFVLHDDLSVRRLRFADELTEQSGDIEDAAARFDADFAIMSVELGEFIPALMSAINGTREL
ncbi:MAG: recombination-associated protein RdgC, partial [Gammaproteobacteria bacterium]